MSNTTKEQRDFIEEVIQDIMIKDGPDGHTDGSNLIADFVIALMNEKGKEWHEAYINKNDAELNRMLRNFPIL